MVSLTGRLCILQMTGFRHVRCRTCRLNFYQETVRCTALLSPAEAYSEDVKKGLKEFFDWLREAVRGQPQLRPVPIPVRVRDR